MIGKFSKLTSATVVLLFSAVSISQSLVDIAAYRGADGTLSQASRQAIVEFTKEAAKSGDIRLWIGFDMSFQGDADLRTPEVVQAEADQKQLLISEVILPMSGVTLTVTPDHLAGAPGCMVIADANGVVKLAKNLKIIHISHHPLMAET